MGELKLKAIVLSSINYKEKDKIINIFSLEHGLMSASLRGVRSPKAKLKFASQPFCFGDFILIQKGNINVVTSVNVDDSFYDLTKDLDTYYLAFTLLEIIKVSLMENESNPLVFINTLKALKLMCYEKVNAKLVLVKFVVGMLKVLGYRFNFKICDACGLAFINKKFLNMSTGAFNCGSCVTYDCKAVSNAVFNALKIISNTEMDKIKTVTISEEHLKDALKLMLQNFEARVSRKLKTIKQL